MRRIVCAAIKVGDRIICGPRHFDSIMVSQLDAFPDNETPIAQGFVDQYGIFLTREEAFEVASNANQIIRRVGGDEGRLFSENLY